MVLNLRQPGPGGGLMQTGGDSPEGLGGNGGGVHKDLVSILGSAQWLLSQQKSPPSPGGTVA